jgi:transcriptional regulator with XRE-family HTH domain
MMAFRELLRSARARQEPADHGLPVPGRRRGPRVKGLSQDQMDYLLAWSSSQYSRFERGELPSAERLRAVAKLLRCTDAEWEGLHLHLLGVRPPHPLVPGLAAIAAPPQWRRVVEGQRNAAYLTDLCWDVLAVNDPFLQIFPRGEAPTNTLLWMVTAPEARERLVDWRQDWAPTVLAQLRAAVAEHPEHPRLAELVEAVQADPVAGPIWARTFAAHQQPDGQVRRIRHAGRGEEVFQVQLAPGQPGTPGMRTMVLLLDPLDAAERVGV